MFLECKYNKTLEEISRVLVAKIEDDKRQYSTLSALKVATGLFDKIAGWKEIINGVCVQHLTDIIHQELQKRFYWLYWSVIYVSNLVYTSVGQYNRSDFAKQYGIEAAIYYTKINNKLNPRWSIYNRSDNGNEKPYNYQVHEGKSYKDVTHAIAISGLPVELTNIVTNNPSSRPWRWIGQHFYFDYINDSLCGVKGIAVVLHQMSRWARVGIRLDYNISLFDLEPKQ